MLKSNFTSFLKLFETPCFNSRRNKKNENLAVIILSQSYYDHQTQHAQNPLKAVKQTIPFQVTVGSTTMPGCVVILVFWTPFA